MTDLAFAEVLARRAHTGQYEKYFTDRPYVHHLERVVALLKGEPPDVIAVGWLHDIVEDTKLGQNAIDDLFPVEIADAVATLTRIPGQSYDAYITRILLRRQRAAISVKIADLRDHLREETRGVLPIEKRRQYNDAMGRFIEGR